MAVPVVGFVLTSRRPANKIGWIFLGAGLVLGLGFFCYRHGPRGLVAAPGSLPAARAAAWFLNWAWDIPVTGLLFILLLFPTGLLLSRRWRPAAWFVAVVSSVNTAAMVARACRVWADPFTAPTHGWYPGSHTAAFILLPAALLVGVAAVVVRFARSSGEERLQLKWFAAAAVLVVAATIPLALAPQIGLSPGVAAAVVPPVEGGRVWRPEVAFVMLLSRPSSRRGPEVPARTTSSTGAARSCRPSRPSWWRWRSSRSGSGPGGWRTASCMASGPALIKCCRSSPGTSAAGTCTTCCRRWPASWRSEPAPSASSSGCASAPSCVPRPPRTAAGGPVPVDGHRLPALPDTDFGAPVLYQGELLGAITIRMPRDEPLNARTTSR